MRLGDLIHFPKPKVKLSEEDYVKYLEYVVAMRNAKSIVESKYYFNNAKTLIEKVRE